jgi:hypothetical protein
VDKMRALVQTRRKGLAITLESLRGQLRSAFFDVNSGDVENLDDELKQLTTVAPARVMLAQPRGALSDLNGWKQMVQIEDKSRYEKLEAENAALRNQVNQMNACVEFHKKKHQEQWNRGRSRENSRNSDHTGSPPRKKVTVSDRTSQP